MYTLSVAATLFHCLPLRLGMAFIFPLLHRTDSNNFATLFVITPAVAFYGNLPPGDEPTQRVKRHISNPAGFNEKVRKCLDRKKLRMIMKTRSTLSTLVSLSAALDVNFSIFDALDEAEASSKRPGLRKPHSDYRRPARQASQIR
jgi:hypothetical protein